MSSVRRKPDSSFVHELTVQQEKCLVKHAREIFTKLVPAETRLGLTDANRKSVEAAASTSLEIAEVFQRKLMEAGYGNSKEGSSSESERTDDIIDRWAEEDRGSGE